jgi:hypothetical protein
MPQHDSDIDGTGRDETQRSFWRHPAVVAAVAAAIISGLFGLASEILQPGFWMQFKETVLDRERRLDFDVERESVFFARVFDALERRTGSAPDIPARLKAITALRFRTAETPSQAYYPQAVEYLVSYVNRNVEERRRPGERVEVDERGPDVYRPADIIAAIEALQIIRRASGESLPVSLNGIDFHQINLAGLDMEGFQFAHADFGFAFLSKCRCRGADFQHAKFRGAAIWNADFREANFRRAQLAGSKWANVDFSGSNLEEADGLGQLAFFADAKGLTAAQRVKLP